MKKIILVALLAINALLANAQQNFTLTGVVRDKLTSSQLIGAEVKIFDENDSLLAQDNAQVWKWDQNRRASVESAEFNVRIPKRKGEYKIQIAAEEHDTLTQTVSLKNIGNRELQRNLGVFYLTKATRVELDEVTVTATKIKFYHRGDTIVYNADAFQLAEGSMLDELIKQLPGVELKEGGEIFVNGKKVESLLLNGKDFFRGDNEVMLDNLAAYTVKNIEVYKKQTDRARFLGLDGENDKQLTMDVKLKKEYIGGWTGNVEVGAGTEDRYLGKLFAMHFNAMSQFTLIGNINNLNDSKKPTNDNSWAPAYRPNGTKQYREIAGNYNTENADASRKACGSITLRSTCNLFESETNSTNFLQTMNTRSQSISNSLSKELHLQTNHELSFENKWLSMRLNPGLTFSHGRSDSESEGITSPLSLPEQGNENLAMFHLFPTRQSNALSPSGEGWGEAFINHTLSSAFSSNRSIELSSTLSSTIKVPKTSDAIDLTFRVYHKNSRNSSDSRDIIVYGDETTPASARNTNQTDRPQHTNNAEASASYTLRFSDKLNLMFGYAYDYQRSSNTSAFYLGELTGRHTGDYTMENLLGIERSFDPTNSNTSVETNKTHRIFSTLSWQPDNWYISIVPIFEDCRNSLDYHQNGRLYRADFNEKALANFSSDFYWSKNNDGHYQMFDATYYFSRTTPSLTNLIEIENTRNPLVRYLANPDLRSCLRNTMRLYYYASQDNKWSFSINGMLQVADNSPVSGSTYNTQTSQRTFKTYNIDGVLNANARTAFTWYLGKHLRICPEYYHTFRRDYSIVGENSSEPSRYRMNSNTFEPSLMLSYKSSDKVVLTLSSGLLWNKSDSKNPSARNTDYQTQKHSLMASIKLPLDWSITSSILLYKRSGLDDDRMNTTEWVWNSRITKRFMKGKLLCNISAYDLLHQIQSVTYYVTPQSKVEQFTNTIPRYVLLHLQYKMNIQPKKKIAQTVNYY